MSGSQGFLDVLNAEGATIPTTAVRITIDGTAAVSPSLTLLLTDGTVIGDVPMPTNDAMALVALGSVVAQGVTEIGLLGTIATNTAGSSVSLAYTLNSAATVSASSGVLVATGAVHTFLSITTLTSGTADVWLNPSGGAAVVGSGVPVFAGGGNVTFGKGGQYPLPTGNLTAISSSGSVSVALAGG